jgi:glycine/D-amino acid oxidase-like deaminating enzyme
MHRVEHVEVVAPYTLALRFEDGAERQVDLEPILEGEMFGPLRDPSVFSAVEIDRAFGTVQWPNGADFDPDTLYDWPKYRSALIKMAREWAKQTGSGDKR